MIGMQQNIVFLKDRNGLTVRLSGEIDHHRAVEVRVGIDERLIAERPSKLILELSKVDFMDSSGLGLIMGRYALCQQYGIAFSVLDPSPAVMKMIRLAGMQKLLTVENSEKTNKKSS